MTEKSDGVAAALIPRLDTYVLSAVPLPVSLIRETLAAIRELLAHADTLARELQKALEENVAEREAHRICSEGQQLLIDMLNDMQRASVDRWRARGGGG